MEKEYIRIFITNKLLGLLRRITIHFEDAKRSLYLTTFISTEHVGVCAIDIPIGNISPFLSKKLDKQLEYNCFDVDTVNYGKITAYKITNTAEELITKTKGFTKKQKTVSLKASNLITLCQSIILPENISLREHLLCYPEKVKKLYDTVSEEFTNSLKVLTTPFEYHISENVSEIYGLKANPKAGILVNSCMRPDSSYDCHGHAEFYDGLCRIVYNKDSNNRLLYRALLWNLKHSKTGEEITFLDRIYSDDATELKLHEIARQNSWYYRVKNRDSKSIISPKTLKPIEDSHCFFIKIPEHCLTIGATNGTPYIDTINKYTKDGLLYHTSYINSYMKNLASTGHTQLPVMIKCAICGEMHEGTHLTRTIEGSVCLNCFDKKYYTCSGCGKVHLLSELTLDLMFGHLRFCSQSCLANSDFRFCTKCGKLHHRDVMLTYKDKIYCEECYDETFILCPICNERHSETEIQTIVVSGFEEQICNNCLHDNTFTCPNCNSLHWSVEREDYEGQEICYDCYSQLTEENEITE